MDTAHVRPNVALRLALLAAALFAGGCATVSGTSTQPVSIRTVDAFDRPVDGMRCRIANSAAEYFGTTPLFDLQVRRSASDLRIECRRGELLAHGTAVSRGGHLAGVLLPGGTAALVIDHLTGYRYSYPAVLRLRIGEHLVFDGDRPPQGRPRLELAFDVQH